MWEGRSDALIRYKTSIGGMDKYEIEWSKIVSLFPKADIEVWMALVHRF